MRIEKKYILSFDLGTTSVRAMLFDKKAQLLFTEQQEITQYYPKTTWVEQNPDEIFTKAISCFENLIKKNQINPSSIAGIGITNQRETTIVWHKETGNAIYNAIVWQDKRTTNICNSLQNDGWHTKINQKTGLFINPYFSATKLSWILEHVTEAKQLALDGALLFGTVDTYFLWRLTNKAVHATDVSNASRTMLYNINTLEWDAELLNLFGIPASLLPNVKDTSTYFGHSDKNITFNTEIPIYSLVGDQQSALFGQACLEKGMLKNTYGTGCFILMNCGSKPVLSKNGLITTIAWRINNQIVYALEGSVFVGGSVIKWLRDNLNLLNKANESENMARKSTQAQTDLFFVPAFSGLGAPHWNMEATGMLIGLSFDTKKEDIARAALDALAYQCTDVILAMQKDSNTPIKGLNVDGGASVNNYLMQFQADLLQINVVRPYNTESTALGAALLAGLQTEFWSLEDILNARKIDKTYIPILKKDKVEKLYARWLGAVERSKNWT